MDGLCVRPVLPESREEFDHSVDAPPVATPSSPRVIKVEPLPKSTMAVAAVATSFGRRAGGHGTNPSSTSDEPLISDPVFDLVDEVLR